MTLQNWLILGGFLGTIAAVIFRSGRTAGRVDASIAAADDRYDRHEEEDVRRHGDNVVLLRTLSIDIARLGAKMDTMNGSVAEAKRDIEVLRNRR